MCTFLKRFFCCCFNVESQESYQLSEDDMNRMDHLYPWHDMAALRRMQLQSSFSQFPVVHLQPPPIPIYSENKQKMVKLGMIWETIVGNDFPLSKFLFNLAASQSSIFEGPGAGSSQQTTFN